MSYHRNGVSGRGFWHIIFKGHDEAGEQVAGYRFIATFFPAEEVDPNEEECERHRGPDYGPEEACVAVLRVEDINAGNAEMAWRGDNFHDELQTLVDSYVWKYDRNESLQLDGAGRELTNRHAAIRAQKERKAQDLS
jgi:hypothetical protein